MKRKVGNIDLVTGQRIRNLRKIMGLSQSNLADMLDVSFQQVQKYETGKNRISLETLETIATALNTTAVDLLEKNQDEERSAIPQALLKKIDSSGINLSELASVEVVKNKMIMKNIVELIQAVNTASINTETQS